MINTRLIRFAIIVAALAAIDFVTKWWAVTALSDGARQFPGPVDLQLHYNTGTAFGLFTDLPPIVISVATVLFIAVVANMWRSKHPEAFEFAWDLDQWVDESDEMERSQVLAHYFEDLQQARQADGTLTSVSYIDDAYKDSWDSFRYLDQAIAKLPQLQPLKKCWQTLASAIRKGKVPSPRSGVSGADGESVKLEPGNVQFGDQT